jgi:hypothetical protein
VRFGCIRLNRRLGEARSGPVGARGTYGPLRACCKDSKSTLWCLGAKRPFVGDIWKGSVERQTTEGKAYIY